MNTTEGNTRTPEENAQVKERLSIGLAVNWPEMHRQFMREFEAGVEREIRHARNPLSGAADDGYGLKVLRETLVHLNIAIQSIDTIEALTQFREQLGEIVSKLAAAHDELTQ